MLASPYVRLKNIEYLAEAEQYFNIIIIIILVKEKDSQEWVT